MDSSGMSSSLPSESRATSINPGVFYKSSLPSLRFRNVELSDCEFDFEFPKRLTSIVDGPCRTWKVFKKQNDALKFCCDNGSGLMTFAFQDSDGNRRFLSAHPVVFWFYDCHKRAENRRTYEVITEGALCKLYFDLEFDKECNKFHDGVRMTNTFINIVSYFMKEEFDIMCDRKLILDLDSTTEIKFSRHLIYILPHAVFRDNYNVGSFVKMICGRVKLLMLSLDELKLLSSKSGVRVLDVQELCITDKKGVNKLFCDEGVYTKNRHFRLYMSTKFKKNSPLLLSGDNEFKSREASDNSLIQDEQMFLNSLVTYVGDVSQNQTTILEYTHGERRKYVVKSISNLPDCPVVSGPEKSSPVPVVDRFIQRIISPGKIRCSTYIPSSRKVLYEVFGNRFCNNIGRAHKSNNVYYVADLANTLFFQKCHDPDCAGYRSENVKLPPEIVFYLENEGDFHFDNSDLTDSELQEVWESVQALSDENGFEVPSDKENDFGTVIPDLGLSDTELLNIQMGTDDVEPL